MVRMCVSGRLVLVMLLLILVSVCACADGGARFLGTWIDIPAPDNCGDVNKYVITKGHDGYLVHYYTRWFSGGPDKWRDVGAYPADYRNRCLIAHGPKDIQFSIDPATGYLQGDGLIYKKQANRKASADQYKKTLHEIKPSNTGSKHLPGVSHKTEALEISSGTALAKYWKVAGNVAVGSVNGQAVTKDELLKMMWFWNAPFALTELANMRLIENEAQKFGISVTAKELQEEIAKGLKKLGVNGADQALTKFKVTKYRQAAFTRTSLLIDKIVRKEKRLTGTDISKEQAEWLNKLYASGRVKNELLEGTPSLGQVCRLQDGWNGTGGTIVGTVDNVPITKAELIEYMWFTNAPTTLLDIFDKKMVEEAALQAGVSLTQEEDSAKDAELVKRAGVVNGDEYLAKYKLTLYRMNSNTAMLALADKVYLKTSGQNALDGIGKWFADLRAKSKVENKLLAVQ